MDWMIQPECRTCEYCRDVYERECGKVIEHEANHCSDWEPRGETLEQRYSKLEQIARDMLGCVFGHRYDDFRACLRDAGVQV